MFFYNTGFIDLKLKSIFLYAIASHIPFVFYLFFFFNRVAI